MRSLAHIPGHLGLPVLGHSLRLVRDCNGLMEERRARYGDVFLTRWLGRVNVIFLTPQATRDMYLDADKVLSSELGWASSIGPLFGGGLMLRDFKDHHVHRRVMQQAFTRNALAGYVEHIQALTDRHLDRLPPGHFDVYVRMKRLTLDIAAEVFVGASLGTQADEVNRAFAETVAAAVAPVRLPLPGSAFARGLRARRRLEVVFSDLVRRRRAEEPRADLLSRLSHAETADGQQLTVAEVVDHMIFLMLAAHDTTTSTLAVMLWHLAKNPDWQDRVRDEVRGLDGAPVTMSNHSGLTDTTMAMNEAMRLHPPVPFSPRVAVRDTVVDGVPIPEGTLVASASTAMHRHPDWWTEPDRFDPMRFAPGREEHLQHSHLFVPFGGGAHLCLGNHVAELVVKTVAARLLPRRRLTADAGATVDITPVPIPRPRGPMVLGTT